MGWQMQAVAAVGSLMAARQQAGAYANDAQAAYERAEEVAMQAEQKEIARKNQLNENLASLSSMFAGGGV